jgi:hypothetical protein
MAAQTTRCGAVVRAEAGFQQAGNLGATGEEWLVLVVAAMLPADSLRQAPWWTR